ncbi:MAG: DUF3626 domain-containing protein [Williamsia herbipolensis]|nr:DUF3626 domain-containing protein [Williamsia herbipolensis]
MTGTHAVDLVRQRAVASRPDDTRRALATLHRHHPWVFRTIPDPNALAREFARFAVTVNFHPDRLARDGRSTAAGLLTTGTFRSQFATGISSGSLSPDTGGERLEWERQLFGLESADADHRPCYGALNLAGHPDGAAPRFGSCFLELSPTTRRRSTLSVGDSHQLPHDLGTFDEAMGVLAGLLELADRTGTALRSESGDVRGIVESLGRALPGLPSHRAGRALDDYLEVQIHGPIHLDTDVTALVVDPSFRGTATGDELTAAAATHGVRVRWHRGSGLHADDVDPEFRGPRITELARWVEQRFGGPITADTVGLAHRELVGRPPPVPQEDWAQRNQELKQLWHAVVEFGKPLR